MFQLTCAQNSTFLMVLNTFADFVFSQHSCKVALRMCCRHQIYYCGHLLCKVSLCFQASDRFHSAKPLITAAVPGRLGKAASASLVSMQLISSEHVQDSDPGLWCQIIGKLKPVTCPNKAGAMESQSPQILLRNWLTTISCDVSDAHHIFKHTS